MTLNWGQPYSLLDFMPPFIIDNTNVRDVRRIWEIDIDKPHRWFQALTDTCKTGLPFEEFREQDYLLIGVRNGKNELLGGFILEQLSEDCMNVHVAVKDGSAFDEMVRSGVAVQGWLKDRGIAQVVAWSVRQNFPINRLAKRLGFYRTGLSRVDGNYNGKALEWHQYLLDLPNKESDKI